MEVKGGVRNICANFAKRCMVCEEVWDEGGWFSGDPSAAGRPGQPTFKRQCNGRPEVQPPNILPSRPLSLLKYEIN